MRVSLDEAWAKLNRAKHHAGVLRGEIDALGAGTSGIDPTDADAIPIPLGRYYDPNEGAVIYRIGRIPQIRDAWPLLAGDAIQGFRASLDYLMWQLAVIHLRRQPTDREAPSIQFPSITRKRDLAPGAHRFLNYIRPADIALLSRFQPYRRRSKGELHPLPKLVRLSNIDKHRRLHLLVVAAHQASFTNRVDAHRDCVPVLQPAPDGGLSGMWYHTAPSRPLRSDSEILRIPVRPIGPNPDVEVDARLVGWVVIGRLGPVVRLLDAFSTYVSNVLTAFEPVMAAARANRT